MKEYLNINEFSEITGINKSELYKRLDSDLLKYYKKIDGLKHIHISAIDYININKTNSNKDINNNNNNISNNDYIEYLKEEIKDLKEQIKNKDNIIAEYTKQILEYTKKSQELTEKAIATTSQQQYLQAIEHKSFIKRLFSRTKKDGK